MDASAAVTLHLLPKTRALRVSQVMSNQARIQRLRLSRVNVLVFGSHPAEAVGFLGRKKSSARLPSEGK